MVRSKSSWTGGQIALLVIIVVAVLGLAGVSVFLFVAPIRSALNPPGMSPVAAPAAQPKAAPTVYGTIQGYTDTTGRRTIDINLFNKPAGDAPPFRNVGYAHEGQRVAVIEQRADGTIKVRTPDGIEGWTQIDFVTDIQ